MNIIMPQNDIIENNRNIMTYLKTTRIVLSLNIAYSLMHYE
ncbi:hypothetical protein [Legionella shakespearei]|nr:hypothetical protein [Legionella shakespearei]